MNGIICSFFRTYVPSEISRVVGLWKESLAKVSEKAAKSLADPEQYENLFGNLEDSVKGEKFLKRRLEQRIPAAAYPKIPVS